MPYLPYTFKFPKEPIPVEYHQFKYCVLVHSGMWHHWHYQQRANALRRYEEYCRQVPTVILNYGSVIKTNERAAQLPKEPEDF